MIISMQLSMIFASKKVSGLPITSLKKVKFNATLNEGVPMDNPLQQHAE